MNSDAALIALIAVAVIGIVVILLLFLRTKRSERLRARFGPEYQRTVQETGSKTRAESKLEHLEKRVDRFHIRPLDPPARAKYTEAWRAVQARFVDDPKGALTEADRLVQEIMSARGYPVADFEQRAADLSVNHPVVCEHYRAGHEISVRHSQGRASTEDMRQAMIHYRKLFAELADEPEMARSAAAGDTHGRPKQIDLGEKL